MLVLAQINMRKLFVANLKKTNYNRKKKQTKHKMLIKKRSLMILKNKSPSLLIKKQQSRGKWDRREVTVEAALMCNHHYNTS